MAETSSGKKYILHIEKAVARAQGSRDHQEDNFSVHDRDLKEKGYGVYCVFDGHGTDVYSAHASKHMAEILMGNEEFKQKNYVEALKTAFFEENEAMKKKHEKGIIGGTTATVALFADGTLYLANVGDSRSVLGVAEKRSLQKEEYKAIRMSRDHSFEDANEIQRIVESGGDVKDGRVRQNGHGINMTRALGDFDFKQPYNHAERDFISAVPHISTVALSPSESFLVLASDGLWVDIGDQQLVELIISRRNLGESPEQIVGSIVETISKGSVSDNITVMLLIFDWKEIPSSEKPIIIADPIQHKMKGLVEVYAPA